MRATNNLTKAEARAIMLLIDLGWADYDAMTDFEKSCGQRFDKRWLAFARSADHKINAIVFGRKLERLPKRQPLPPSQTSTANKGNRP